VRIPWKTIGLATVAAASFFAACWLYLSTPLAAKPMYDETLKLLGGTAILVAAVAWLIRSLLLHFMSKDVESYKEQLKSANALELEKLRANLSQQTLEHEVKFRRTDEKIAEHLTVVYQKLFNLYRSVLDYVKIFEFGGEPSKEEKHKVVLTANDDFWDYFLHNRPYIPPKMYKQIKDIADLLAKTAREFAFGQDREKRGLPTKGEDHWEAALENVEHKATPMFSEMVAEVQRRLGVFDPESE
jgi:hypothetical protein